jgi:ribosome-associated translation inhibitor RaiA
VEIVFHSHHAIVSDRTRLRAQRGVEKVARRLTRVVSAVVRFEQDGQLHRVELVLQPARGRLLVAEGSGRYFGPALAAALAHMEAQASRVRRQAKERARKVART